MISRSIKGLKVVTSQEMARIEKMAISEGHSELVFMENAAESIANSVDAFVFENDFPKVVSLLVGKGNNGGDCFAAGAKLIELGYEVSAFSIYLLDLCSPLCQKMAEKFHSLGGKIIRDSLDFPSEGIILDGLVGTGFKGKAEGSLAFAIQHANRSGLPILSIDIPSGLSEESAAVRADGTIFLELPKAEFFSNQGWGHVGKLHQGVFGLPEKYTAEAKPLYYLVNEEALAEHLPLIERTRHKYQAGYVLAVAGSLGMPGAAILSSYAALRAGAGIVRLFHPLGMEAELASAPPELIREGWDGKDLLLILKEAVRAKSLLVGPGIGRSADAKEMVKSLFAQVKLPMVIDADALFFLSQHPEWHLPKGSVITPHRGEMDLLLIKKTFSSEGYHERCQMYAEEKQVTLILKGAPTFVFHPGTIPLVITRGDPGMATAGSGDVLTGIVAALLAEGLAARDAAVLGAQLHGISGEIAAEQLTSYCMTASDLIEFLPDAFDSVLHFG